MKMKRILLVTFLLLAVLTIGAASAEDNNATSDDLQVADDGDDIVELDYDSDYHEITPWDEEMCIDEDDDDYYDESVVDITLPKNAKGNFTVFNGKVKVAETAISKTDDHWEFDDEDATGYLYLEDFDLTKINDGDNLTFMFFELKNSQYVPVNGLTVTCKVSLKDSVLLFYDISNAEGDESDNDGILEVSDMDLNNTDENFTYVYVAEKDGIFRITINPDENDEFVIFEEYLKNSERKYVIDKDDDGEEYLKFGFSLTDINNYIAQNVGGADSLKDLIDNGYLYSGGEMYFELVEDDEDETDMDSITMIVTITDDKISFKDDDAEEDVDVDYDNDNLDIVMDEGWNETVVLEYIVKRGIKGNIVIYLNDDETPAFNRTLSECTPQDYDEDDEEDVYNITIADLNISQAGQYVLYCYFLDEDGDNICAYDNDDPETLILTAPQIVTGDNVTIIFINAPIRVDEIKTIIKINATDVQDEDEILIYVDDNEPMPFTFENCEIDGDGFYVITSDQLDLSVGQHTINITCKGTNSTGNVINVTTDLEIDLADEAVYTTLKDAFVFIGLVDAYITEVTDINGLINVTITDSEGNVIDAIQKDIEDGMDADSDYEYYVIRTSDLNVELNGTYTVSVIYYNGTKGFVQTEGNVTFKAFEPVEYGVSISDKIVDDRIITFSEVPFDYNFWVEVDDDRLVIFSPSELAKGLDSQNKTVHFIKQDQLNLTDGPHSIKVSIFVNGDTVELANVNVTVDLKENADPALTVSVANIEVGNAATVLITTNSSFTGNVKVQVANKTYDVNVTNGQGNVSVTGLDVGEYIATATFEADAFFNASVKTAAFNVTAKPVTPGKENTTPVTPAKEDTKPVAKKTKVKLTLKKVKVKRSAKKLVLTATLKINGKAAKKKKITFKFKGKKYKAKTNKKGVAKVTIKKKVLKKLKKGKKVKIQASYGKTVKKYTVKVRK